MEVLIVDDEPLARKRLESLLAECDGVRVIGSLGDADAALVACADLHPDLLLLDIRMPGLDGIGMARKLRALPKPPQIVFCTAFDAHAIDAWELQVAGYLRKPVSPERLRQALARVAALRADNADDGFLHARLGDEQVRVSLDEVLYLDAGDKYVTAHCRDHEVLLDASLRTLEQTHPERLLRLHRNCLVPRERLLGLRQQGDGKTFARIAGSDVQLEVSRRQLPALRKILRD